MITTRYILSGILLMWLKDTPHYTHQQAPPFGDFKEHIFWGDVATLFLWQSWCSIFAVYVLSSLIKLPILVAYPDQADAMLRRLVVPHNISVAKAADLFKQLEAAGECNVPHIFFSPSKTGAHTLDLVHFVTVYKK
jgi:hypothetical protein